jgi:hypothetical protein
MVTKSLGIVALSLFGVFSGICLAQTTTVPAPLPDNFILLVPPEFIGNPSTGSSPNRRWVYVGSYAAQGDCESAKATMQYPIVDGNGIVTRQALPGNSICLSKADYNNLN